MTASGATDPPAPAPEAGGERSLPRVSVGIHTGKALVEKGDVFGDMVNVAGQDERYDVVAADQENIDIILYKDQYVVNAPIDGDEITIKVENTVDYDLGFDIAILIDGVPQLTETIILGAEQTKELGEFDFEKGDELDILFNDVSLEGYPMVVKGHQEVESESYTYLILVILGCVGGLGLAGYN